MILNPNLLFLSAKSNKKVNKVLTMNQPFVLKGQYCKMIMDGNSHAQDKNLRLIIFLSNIVYIPIILFEFENSLRWSLTYSCCWRWWYLDSTSKVEEICPQISNKDSMSGSKAPQQPSAGGGLLPQCPIILWPATLCPMTLVPAMLCPKTLCPGNNVSQNIAPLVQYDSW